MKILTILHLITNSNQSIIHYSYKIRLKQKFKTSTGAGSRPHTTKNGKNKIKFKKWNVMNLLLLNNSFTEQKSNISLYFTPISIYLDHRIRKNIVCQILCILGQLLFIIINTSLDNLSTLCFVWFKDLIKIMWINEFKAIRSDQSIIPYFFTLDT